MFHIRDTTTSIYDLYCQTNLITFTNKRFTFTNKRFTFTKVSFQVGVTFVQLHMTGVREGMERSGERQGGA